MEFQHGPYGEEYYLKIRMMGRNYLGFQKQRVAAGARIRRFRDEDQSKEIISLQLMHLRELTRSEKMILKDITKLAGEHKLHRWCMANNGLGPMAEATFLSYIDPYKADKMSNVKSYFGLYPNAIKKAGKKTKFNPQARGRMHVVVGNIVRQGDSYYADLYYQRKALYESRMGEYIEDPTKCPKYKECLKKLKDAAERDDDREPKRPACKGHIDSMAKRWLATILVVHALMIMREQEGLDNSNFYAHDGFIPYNPH